MFLPAFRYLTARGAAPRRAAPYEMGSSERDNAISPDLTGRLTSGFDLFVLLPFFAFSTSLMYVIRHLRRFFSL